MSTGIGLSAPELQRRALRGAAWSTVSAVVALPFAVVVSVVVARALGPHEFGRYAYLTFLVPLVFQLTDLGASQATVREATRSFAAGSLSETRSVIAKASGWNLIRLAPTLALVLLIARPEPLVAVLYAVYLVLLMATGGLAFGLSAENRVAVAAKISFLEGLAGGGAAIGAALAGCSGTTVWALSAICPVVVLPVSLAVANPELRRAALRPRLPRRLPPGFWRFGGVTAAVGLLYVLVFSRSEVVILDALDEHQALAVFALAYGLAQRLTVPVDTMLGPLALGLSALDRAHPEKFRLGFERALRISVAGTGFLAAASLAAVTLLAPQLYGAGYAGVGLVFAALAVVSLVRSAAQPYVALAYAEARPGTALRAYAVALVVDVALTAALVPPLGVWGAVVGSAAGGLVAVVLLARAVAGRASLRAAGVPAAKVVAVTVAACGLAFLAGTAAAAVTPLLGVAAAIVVGAAVFLACVRGALSDGDATVLTEALPRRLAPGARVVALLAR